MVKRIRWHCSRTFWSQIEKQASDYKLLGGASY